MSNASTLHANRNKRSLLTELHLEPVVRKRLLHERLRRWLIYNRRHRVHPAQKRKRTRQIRRGAILRHNVRRHVIQRRLRVRIPGVPRQLRLIRNLRTKRLVFLRVSHRVLDPSRASFIRSFVQSLAVGRSNEKKPVNASRAHLCRGRRRRFHRRSHARARHRRGRDPSSRRSSHRRRGDSSKHRSRAKPNCDDRSNVHARLVVWHRMNK